MKHLHLILLLAFVVSSALYCDGDSSISKRAGGPSESPQEIPVDNPGDNEATTTATDEITSEIVKDPAEKTPGSIIPEVKGEDSIEDLANNSEITTEIITDGNTSGTVTGETITIGSTTTEPVTGDSVAAGTTTTETADTTTKPKESDKLPEEVISDKIADSIETSETVDERESEELEEAIKEVEKEKAEKEESADDEGEKTKEEVKEEAKEEAAIVKVTAPKVEIDTSRGKWYQTETKPLDIVSSGEYDKNTALIKEYRMKINDLRKDKVIKTQPIKDQILEKQAKIKELRSSITKENKKDIQEKIKSISDSMQTLNATLKSTSKEYNEKIDNYLTKIEKCYDKIGYAKIQKGIHTYWANQPLVSKIKGVTTPGWYRLRIVAKNVGTLPKWYKNFNISITNETTGKEVGGLFIPASDSVYMRGRTLVYLDKGDNDLILQWTNDAYEKNAETNGYNDANIQIRNISIRFEKSINTLAKFVRTGHQYSKLEGTFFWDDSSVYTYWAGQTITFNFPGLSSGKYQVFVWAKNLSLTDTTKLPDNYDAFKINVDGDGTEALLEVKANDNSYNKGVAVLDLTGGDTDISLTWTNDAYQLNVFDANIQIKKIQIKRIGDSERSALAAYLLGTSQGKTMLLTGSLLTLLLLIGGLALINRRRVNAIASKG